MNPIPWLAFAGHSSEQQPTDDAAFRKSVLETDVLWKEFLQSLTRDECVVFVREDAEFALGSKYDPRTIEIDPEVHYAPRHEPKQGKLRPNVQAATKLLLGANTPSGPFRPHAAMPEEIAAMVVIAERQSWRNHALDEFGRHRFVVDHYLAHHEGERGQTDDEQRLEVADLERRLEVREHRIPVSERFVDRLYRYEASGSVQVGTVGVRQRTSPETREHFWLEALREWRVENAAKIAARRIIRSLCAEGDALASHSDALGNLQREIERTLPDARKAVAVPAPEKLDDIGSIDGMFATDAGLAAFVEALPDSQAKDAATSMRTEFRKLTNSAENWRDPIYLVRYLAGALWTIRVRPGLERDYRRPPALAMIAFENFTATNRSGLQVQNGVVCSPDGKRIAPLSPPDRLNLPTVELDTLQTIIPKGVELLGSVNAARLFLWEVQSGHEQFIKLNTDPRTLRVLGGWQGLADTIGAGSKKGAGDVRAIVAAQAHLLWTKPDGSYGNLLSYSVNRRRGAGGQNEVVIVLGDLLMPGFVHELQGNSLSTREARRLVPIPSALPQLVGNNRVHGQQAQAFFRLLAELRRRAPEISEEGGAALSRGDLERIFGEVNLGSEWIDPVISAWVAGGDNAPAFIRKDGDRYNLADARARDFLAASGKAEADGRRAGEMGGTKRRAKVARHGHNRSRKK